MKPLLVLLASLLPLATLHAAEPPLFDPKNPDVGVEKPEMTEEARDAKQDFKDWERPRMTQ